MKLSDIAKYFNLQLPKNDVDFTNLSLHSQSSLQKNLFLAMKGNKSDGHDFIADALKQGCVGIISEREVLQLENVPCLVFPRLQENLSVLSGLVYPGFNSIENIIGVTGTNGKTTITTIIRYLLEKSGEQCGLMGTISCWDGKVTEEASHTTPPITNIFQVLHRCSENKLNYCVMEVSSHALKQERLGRIKLKSGVFTNLTQDHLDYHKTMEDYQRSKLKMLDLIERDGVAVVVGDNELGKEVIRLSKSKVIVVGKGENADFKIMNIKMSLNGTDFSLKIQSKLFSVHIPLIGEHNIYNCVQAVALVNHFGFALESLLEKICHFTGVSGRLEKVEFSGNGPAVFVDYAHTPDAMDNVLRSVQGLKGDGKLWVVFGCGGDRDRGKRPLMAKSAETYCDKIVVTSDNPRTELAEEIIKEIQTGFAKNTNYTSIVDRRKAIEYAIKNADANDLVLLLGKGHEDYQIIGNVKHHFDDKEEAKIVLQKRS